MTEQTTKVCQCETIHDLHLHSNGIDVYRLPDTVDGQPPLPVPAACPVTLDELLGTD